MDEDLKIMHRRLLDGLLLILVLAIIIATMSAIFCHPPDDRVLKQIYTVVITASATFLALIFAGLTVLLTIIGDDIRIGRPDPRATLNSLSSLNFLDRAGLFAKFRYGSIIHLLYLAPTGSTVLGLIGYLSIENTMLKGFLYPSTLFFFSLTVALVMYFSYRIVRVITDIFDDFGHYKSK